MNRALLCAVCLPMVFAVARAQHLDIQFPDDAARDIWWSKTWPTDAPTDVSEVRGADISLEIPDWAAKSPTAYLCVGDPALGNMVAKPAQGLATSMNMTAQSYLFATKVDIVVVDGGKPMSGGTVTLKAGDRSTSYPVGADGSATAYCVAIGSVDYDYAAANGKHTTGTFTIAANRSNQPVPKLTVDLANSGGPPIVVFVGAGIVVVAILAYGAYAFLGSGGGKRGGYGKRSRR